MHWRRKQGAQLCGRHGAFSTLAIAFFHQCVKRGEFLRGDLFHVVIESHFFTTGVQVSWIPNVQLDRSAVEIRGVSAFIIASHMPGSRTIEPENHSEADMIRAWSKLSPERG